MHGNSSRHPTTPHTRSVHHKLTPCVVFYIFNPNSQLSHAIKLTLTASLTTQLSHLACGCLYFVIRSAVDFVTLHCEQTTGGGVRLTTLAHTTGIKVRVWPLWETYATSSQFAWSQTLKTFQHFLKDVLQCSQSELSVTRGSRRTLLSNFNCKNTFNLTRLQSTEGLIK